MSRNWRDDGPSKPNARPLCREGLPPKRPTCARSPLQESSGESPMNPAPRVRMPTGSHATMLDINPASPLPVPNRRFGLDATGYCLKADVDTPMTPNWSALRRWIGMRDDRDQTALSHFLGTGIVDPVNGAA